MFGSEVLEVGIGVTLILLFVSLICTAAREGLETALRTRAADLERTVRELLKDREGTGLTKDLYSHPLIYSLFLGDYDPQQLRNKNNSADKYMPRELRAKLPAYIPAGNFASAILDILVRGAIPTPTAPAPGAAAVAPQAASPPLSIASLRSTAAISRILICSVSC